MQKIYAMANHKKFYTLIILPRFSTFKNRCNLIDKGVINPSQVKDDKLA
ncbi:hypothetical protein [Campylobacter gastrosuis]|uniref:Uncharacterized protein n=1 Tax=Campylobacter gastrosuis TaxID=2974576 RepID=A0ABT7HR64_9BACT|nr:hypothetical protein [Campylobacter gastrosuis]MDL0088879.1 hypothetical protein [Campylobacter gastrosuis]